MADYVQFHWQYEYIMISTGVVLRIRERNIDSSAGIARHCGLDGWDRLPSWITNVSLSLSVQTGCQVHSASYPTGIAGCPRG
jgi:hypothetical protein